MASQDLAQQLLGLPDVEAQRRFLEAHTPQLNDDVASALKDQADQFLRADVSRSLQTADLIFYLAELTHNPNHRALGLLAEANAHAIGKGQYQQADALYDQAAHIYRDHNLVVEHAKSQKGKIWALTNLGRYTEALRIGEWAANILGDNGEWKTLAGLTMNLGIVHSRAGDDAKSLKFFDRAEALYRRVGAEEEPAWYWAHINRAVALRTLGRFDESIQAAQTAWRGLEGLGQKVAAARARQNLALTYFVLGRYNEALEHLDQVRDVFLADGRQRDAMRVELFICDCLLQLRRFGDVFEKCRRVRDLFAELGTRDVVAQAILDESVAYAGLGRYAEALESLAEARQIFEEKGNRAKVAYTNLETAALLLRQGRHAEGMATAQACAAIFREFELAVEEAHAQLIASQAALALGDLDQASELVSHALSVGEARDVPDLRYQGRHLAALIVGAQGNRGGALIAFDRAIEEVERLRGQLMLEYRVSFLEDKERIYEDVVALCLDMVEPALGLEYAERAKSRTLLDLLAYRLDLSIQARAASDQPLVAELLQLRDQRDQVYRRWESGRESGERSWSLAGEISEQAQKEILALEQRITELWHKLLVHNADYARDAALWTVRTEPVQPYLPPDTMLVEYFVVHGKLVVFLVTAETVEARRLDSDLAQLQNHLKFLWLNLKSAPVSALQGKAASLVANAQGIFTRLHELLFAPIAEAVAPYQRLIVVPHGALHYVPFHALYDGASYLIQRCEISYLPGSSLLRYRRETHSDNTSALIVGHPNGGHLPHAVHEARSIASLLGGDALLEEDASRA